MSSLTMEAINGILANTRDRGGAERTITNFVDSGKLAIDLREVPGNEAKKVESLYNSYAQNVRKMTDKAKADGREFPALKVVKAGEEGSETVVLINLDEHARQSAAA